jgi:hypothetical protein
MVVSRRRRLLVVERAALSGGGPMGRIIWGDPAEVRRVDVCSNAESVDLPAGPRQSRGRADWTGKGGLAGDNHRVGRRAGSVRVPSLPSRCGSWRFQEPGQAVPCQCRVLRPIQVPDTGVYGDPDPLGHGRVGLAQGGLEAQRSIGRDVGVVGAALEGDRRAARVGVEVAERVQPGVATMAPTRLTRWSMPASATATSPPTDTPPATTPGPLPSVAIAQSVTRSASRVVCPRIGHRCRRKLPKTRWATCSPGSVPRWPCCHESRLTATKPAAASRRRIGRASCLVPASGAARAPAGLLVGVGPVGPRGPGRGRPGTWIPRPLGRCSSSGSPHRKDGRRGRGPWQPRWSAPWSRRDRGRRTTFHPPWVRWLTPYPRPDPPRRGVQHAAHSHQAGLAGQLGGDPGRGVPPAQVVGEVGAVGSGCLLGPSWVVPGRVLEAGPAVGGWRGRGCGRRRWRRGGRWWRRRRRRPRR